MSRFLLALFVLVSVATDSATPSRLRLDGRRGFHDASGHHVPNRGVSAFQLVELVAHGRAADAARFFEAMQPARFFRVFLMLDKGLFRLTPSEGLAALPKLLDIAGEKDVYLEVTLFAGTRGAVVDYLTVADRAGAICAQHVACASIEIGNELFPLHGSQDERLADVEFLRTLRQRIRAHGEIPVSLGSTHGNDDVSETFRDGDLLDVHGARGSGEDDEVPGQGNWRWVRHTDAQRALADRLQMFVRNAEPRRDDLRCDKHLAMGALTQMYRLGDTFHYGNGLHARPPEGAELVAFKCRVRGWRAIPDDWSGEFHDAGAPGSPVLSFTDAIRVYSSVGEKEAYVVAMGAGPRLSVAWQSDWPHRELVEQDAGARVWRVAR